MLETFGYIFSNIIDTMDSVSIMGQISLLDISIGCAVLGLGVAAFRAIFAAGGDN